MKSTAAVTFSQICALYVLLGCSPASNAPFIKDKVHATIKPYAEYNKIIGPYKYHYVHEPLETLDEKIEGNVSVTTSDTKPVFGIINEDNTAMNYGYSRSKQKDFKYDQFQSFLEALTSANSKIKAMSMTAEQLLEEKEEKLTSNSFNDLVTTEMLQTKYPTTAIVNNYKTTTISPTPTSMPPIPVTTSVKPTEENIMTQTPITTTTQRPKPNKFTCTLCVIIIVKQ